MVSLGYRWRKIRDGRGGIRDSRFDNLRGAPVVPGGEVGVGK
jgi:hypothetical protein